MASNINLSSYKENSSGTDLSNSLTDDDEQIDTTSWTLAKCKKITTHGRIP